MRNLESLSNIPRDSLNADGSNPETLEEIKAQHTDGIEKLNERMDALIATHEQELKELTLRVMQKEAELTEVKAQQEAELKQVKAQQEALQEDNNSLMEERNEI